MPSRSRPRNRNRSPSRTRRRASTIAAGVRGARRPPPPSRGTQPHPPAAPRAAELRSTHPPHPLPGTIAPSKACGWGPVRRRRTLHRRSVDDRSGSAGPVLTARCGLRQGRAMKVSVGVLGSGSWGTALAIQLARTGHPVALWGRNAEMAARLRAAGEHSGCHPGVRFPEGLVPTADLEEACTASDAIVVSCPSPAVRTLGEIIRPMLGRDTLIVSTSKGIEQDTHLTMSGILEAVLPEHAARVSVLSGPSFAREVARGLPTALTAAAGQLSVAERLQHLFNGPTFRVYTSTDLVGVEIGGAVKNVIALAAGVSDGLGFGHNTRAALITRGLAEISRLATHLR